MVYSEFGGDIVTIEVSLSPPYGEQPQVRLTGSLGDVMKESAYAAMTYLRSRQKRFRPDGEFRCDLHVHVPEGAVPKDGPSAGITILTALVSAFSGRPVRKSVAMTGEVTLRGKILPVGGIREKVLAAHRAGIKAVILPEENLPDLEDLPAEVRSDLKFHPVQTADQALEIALV
jgi:ATP-dependent Lon protease